jgi:hydroxypyruvate isomerase
VSLTFSAHISWLFGELPYLERPAAARQAGFATIESAWPEPSERERLPGVVAEQGLAVALINCSVGDAPAGERGFINDPARIAEAERAFTDAAELAELLGAPRINVLVGRALAGIAPTRQRETMLANLRSFAAEAAARGLQIVIEPINEQEYPGYLAPTPDSVAELIELCGSDAIGLLLDLYHVARAGADPFEAIERYSALIGHVQVSDFPGRGPIGSGSLDVWGILQALAAHGYTGALGLEYEPRGSTQASLAFLADERAHALL